MANQAYQYVHKAHKEISNKSPPFTKKTHALVPGEKQFRKKGELESQLVFSIK